MVLTPPPPSEFPLFFSFGGKNVDISGWGRGKWKRGHGQAQATPLFEVFGYKKVPNFPPGGGGGAGGAMGWGRGLWVLWALLGAGESPSPTKDFGFF